MWPPSLKMPRQILPIRCRTDYVFEGINARANREKYARDACEPRRFLGSVVCIGLGGMGKRQLARVGGRTGTGESRRAGTHATQRDPTLELRRNTRRFLGSAACIGYHETVRKKKNG